jgi:hypothetical protein
LAGASIGAPSAGLGHNCTCRANGVIYSLGKLVCVRGKLSRCEMNQNVPSWKVVGNICPVAENMETPRLAANQSFQTLQNIKAAE